jgi:hypothetical protein
MATLRLRNVPVDEDSALTADAGASGVSDDRRAIEALRHGLEPDQVQRSQLVEEVRRDRPRVRLDIATVIRDECAGDRD